MLKKTALNEAHKKLGAKMVEFAGWEMPIQYEGIIAEHKAVRENLGVFDVSHMGEIEISGKSALDLVQLLITNDASMLALNQILYTPMCYENGGTVDDLLLYRLKDRFLLVVNAANIEKDFAWIKKNAQAFKEVDVENASDRYSQLSIAGPKAQDTLQKLFQRDLSAIKYYWSQEIFLLGEAVLISRTGYTGEDGFELYGSPELILKLWEKVIAAGVKPIGLGARDTLRFEAGLLLYGQELDESTTPIEAGIGWTVKEKEIDFNGKKILLQQKREGPAKKLIGFKMVEKGVPRHGYKIYQDEEEVGYVTSGMKSPTLGEYLGMGYISTAHLIGPGQRLEIEIRGQRKEAAIVKLPFYRGSVKR